LACRISGQSCELTDTAAGEEVREQASVVNINLISVAPDGARGPARRVSPEERGREASLAPAAHRPRRVDAAWPCGARS
jgi:hypothetical protein